MHIQKTIKQEKTLLEKVCISPQLSIAAAIPLLDTAGSGMLLLCDEQQHLKGVLTDGDIRRAILKHIPFTDACETIATKNPIVARMGISKSAAVQAMNISDTVRINHLPVLDADGRVADLMIRRDLISHEPLQVEAVIMAGGYGKRLRPLTENMPKPMLPINGQPLMEITINKLKKSGIRDIKVSTHYCEDVIKDYFGDGNVFGVAIDYVSEESPLGTAGALGLMDIPEKTQLVMNGDILTTVDFGAMIEFHRQHEATMTVAICKYEFEIPYGVVTCDGPLVSGFVEHPQSHFFINAGIYLIEPAAYALIEKGEHCDMPELITRLIAHGHKVVNFPIREYWLDIGQHTQYAKAQDDARNGVLQ